MAHELLQLEQPAGVGLGVLQGERRPERMDVCFDAGSLGDLLHEVVDDAIVKLVP